MNKGKILTILLLFAALWVPKYAVGDSLAEKNPNIIFILTDELGYGDLGIKYKSALE